MTDTRRIAPILLLAALAACDQRQPLPTSPVPDAGAEMQVVPAAAPAAPSGAAAVAVTSTSIFLAWMDNSNDELRFEVARRVYAGGAWDAWQPYVDRLANTVNYLDPGVTGGNTYAYRVRACRGTECSAWAVSRTVVAPKLVAPTGVTVVARSPDSARVAWVDASFGESGFELEKRQLAEGVWGDWIIIETPPNITRYDVPGLALGGQYEFRVRACYFEECSGNSTTVSFILAAPAAPQNLHRVPEGAPVTMQWTDASNNETRFEIVRISYPAEGGAAVATHSTTRPANSTEYTDTSVPPGTVNLYSVRACNLAGCSAWEDSPPVEVP